MYANQSTFEIEAGAKPSYITLSSLPVVLIVIENPILCTPLSLSETMNLILK
jgi:hypothetical protein